MRTIKDYDRSYLKQIEETLDEMSYMDVLNTEEFCHVLYNDYKNIPFFEGKDERDWALLSVYVAGYVAAMNEAERREGEDDE